MSWWYEYLIGIDGTIKLILPAIVGLFYWLGGRRHIWLRRFVAPAWLLIYCYFFGWQAIISYPLRVLAYCMGYGKSSKLAKWIKNDDVVRFVCGILYTACSLGEFLATRNVALFTIQIFVGVFCTVLFSRVIKVSAAKEENLICYFTTFLVPWYGNFV